MKITESRANDILHWLDDETGNHALLFEKMTLHRDAAALIRQLQAEVQGAWHAGLDAGREQGRGNHAQQPAAGDGCHCGTCTCNPNMTPALRFDLSPAQLEGAIREHLTRLGWTPPKRRPYNASGSLSEYGVFPECDREPTT